MNIAQAISQCLFGMESKSPAINAPDWQYIAESLVKNHMPSGSGFDSGTELDFARSNPSRLVFSADFHHMNDGGYYDGWTQHTVTVRPHFIWTLDIAISGRNRNQIKEYMGDVFHAVLTGDAPGDWMNPS